MKSHAREKALRLLREAADILEAETEEIVLPGWDIRQRMDADDAGEGRCAGIRAAARALDADGISPDKGTYVAVRDLGFLVRYVGDMLEE